MLTCKEVLKNLLDDYEWKLSFYEEPKKYSYQFDDYDKGCYEILTKIVKRLNEELEICE